MPEPFISPTSAVYAEVGECLSHIRAGHPLTGVSPVSPHVCYLDLRFFSHPDRDSRGLSSNASSDSVACPAGYLKWADHALLKRQLASEAYWLTQLSLKLQPELLYLQPSRDAHFLCTDTRPSSGFPSQRIRAADWMITRAAPGMGLNHLIRQQQIRAVEVPLMLRQLFDGLQRCHAQQVVHGDLKPANLIWCAQTSQLTLIDWGSASVIGQPIRDLPWRSFSPSYALPSVQRGDNGICAAMDWFSFLILEQLITGQGLPVFPWHEDLPVTRFYQRVDYGFSLKPSEKAFLTEQIAVMDRLEK